MEDSPYDAFEIENQTGAYTATQHLIERGYERIGIILGPTESHDVRERVKGYRAALSEGGIDPDAQAVIEGDFTQSSGYAAGHEMLALDTLPDAFFVCNDYMAIGAMSALQEEGIRIPDDVAIAGFDDIPSARYATPSLTTIRVPVYDLGRQAAQRLLAMIHAAEPPSPCHRTLPSELIVRSSS